jgi:uncharacterized cupin superfamily protein
MSQDNHAPQFNVHTTSFDPLPEFGGGKAILYQSPDGKRVAGSFRESGTHRMTMPFDEFIYVIAGGTRITIGDDEGFFIGVGDACYLKQGQDVLFEMTDDFHDVTVLMSDSAIEV